MNDYIKNIRINNNIPDYSKMGIEASPESELTLFHFGKERTFKCPDGSERVFSWHSKIKGANLRIHFYPLSEDNSQLIIGYIGRHLRTWQFKT